jgi:16S rRNA pseudouridine516 synthase
MVGRGCRLLRKRAALALIRLDRLLSSRGYCTRSLARSYLKEVEVLIDGIRATKEDAKVDESRVMIDAEPIDAGRIVAMLHKPAGAICSHDEGEGTLVYDLLPERWMQRNPPVTSVGRLDKETSGLLIITDDGQLVHRLTSPKKHVEKVYRATLAHALNSDEAGQFASGTMLLRDDPKPLLPATLEVIGEKEVRLTIVEGRYHQVRRMFAAVGNHVVLLHRERVGSLTLGDLPEGQWRMLGSQEVP